MKNTDKFKKNAEMDEFIDCESMDFFIVLCHYTNYKTFPKEKSMKMEFTANTLELNLKKRRS